MSQQGLRQASVRAITGTTYDYNGDWHALFDLYDIPAGDYNGRLLAWINQVLATNYTEINGAMQAFAEEQGAYNWSSMGSFAPLVFVFNRTPNLPPNATLTRATVDYDGSYFDSSGDLQTASPNQARFTYKWNGSAWVLAGVLVEPERTNSVENNSTFTGLVAGSPGTNPTGYSGGTATGATRTLGSPTSENGIPYFSGRWNAPVAQTSSLFFNMMPFDAQAAAAGEAWGYSEYVKLLDGSNTNLVSSPNFRLSGRNAPVGAAETENFAVTYSPTNAALATQRPSVTGTLANAGTAFVGCYMRAATDTTNPSDYTYAIGGQQLEHIPAGQSGVSSLILTSGGAATRAEDVLTLTVPPAVYDIEIVREDGTTTITDLYIDGSYIVPTSVSPLQTVTFTRKGPFTPLAFADCVLWLDGADPATIVESGGAVSDWLDKSTAGNDADQSSSGARPTYTSGQGVQFSTGKSLALPADIRTLFSGTTFTVFHCFTLQNEAPTQSPGGALNALFGQNGPLYFAGVLFWNYYNGTSLTSVNTGSTTTGFKRLTTRANGTSYVGRRGGVQVVNASDLAALNMDAAAVGSYGDGNNSLNGIVHEFIIYAAALTDEQIEIVESYLMSKWGA